MELTGLEWNRMARCSFRGCGQNIRGGIDWTGMEWNGMAGCRRGFLPVRSLGPTGSGISHSLTRHTT